MDSSYRYGVSSMIPDFKFVRVMTLWAGGLGMLQSIAWMGLTITAIISYNCIIALPGSDTFDTVVDSVFLFTYFRSDGCSPKPKWNTTVIQSYQVLSQKDILIWSCVYLGVAVCWLLASSLLLIYVRKENAKQTAGIMLNWVFFTFCICLMDLALGIIFGIDFHSFRNAAKQNNAFQGNGAVQIGGVYLVGGMISAISMLILSLKGFVLWIINFGLMMSLLIISMRTLKDNDGNDTLFVPRKESDDILTTRPPIKAYEEIIEYNNVAYVPDNTQNPSMDTIELNQEPIARAARISTDVTLKDRRFRNLDAFQQYPPPRYATNNGNNNNNNNIYTAPPRSAMSSTKDDGVSMSPTVVVGASGVPAPDYTPPMSRSNQNSSQNNGILRNQRY